MKNSIPEEPYDKDTVKGIKFGINGCLVSIIICVIIWILAVTVLI